MAPLGAEVNACGGTPTKRASALLAFQRYQDADRVKARLALAGVSAEIQRVVINRSDIWYRMRVGPFNDLKSLQGAPAPHGWPLNYMLVKVKPGQGAG